MVLPLVLAFTILAGLTLIAAVTLAVTSMRTGTALQGDRDVEYAAASALDLHIEFLRNDQNLAPDGGPCPGMVTTINGVEVTVVCANPATAYLGRDIDLTASVDGDIVLSASVHIDFGIKPPVDVNVWAYD